jgi:serine phosphatase RsbU (regulator of sigma subunit)
LPSKLFKYLCIFLFIQLRFFAQQGNYFIHNYLPSQYIAADQNRCVIQDKYGRLMVANNDGVLINNGTEWQILRLPFLCLSLAIDENEQIFVAGDGNFGKLTSYSNGEFKYESLVEMLPKDARELGRFWSIITLKKHVYFCSNQKILDYDYQKIKSILPGEQGFHTFFKVGDKLVVKERGKGLEYLSYNNEMSLFKGGAAFADNAVPVRGIIKGAEDHFIISPAGVYRFKFNNSLPEMSEIAKIETAADAWLSEKTVYCAATVGDQNFAFGSVNGGLLITDREFRPLKYINASNELQDDGVNFIYNDYAGHIWLALAKGISLIEVNNPITRFTKSDGVKGTIEDCICFGGSIYLATDKGLLRYNPQTLKFESTNVSEVTWCLKEVNGELLAGAKSGIYRFEKGEFKRIFEAADPHCIYHHEKKGAQKPDAKLFVGTERGYHVLELSNGALKEQFSADMGADIRGFCHSGDNILLGSTSSGIFVIPAGSDSARALKETGALSLNNECSLLPYEKDILVFNEGKAFKISSSDKGLGVVPYVPFQALQEKYVFLKAHLVQNGRIWLNFKPKGDMKAGEGLMCLVKEGNEMKVYPTQLSRIKEADTKSFCTNDTMIYIGTNNGLYCYDLRHENLVSVLNTFVNRVKFGRDSASFFYNLNPNAATPKVELGYRNNMVEVYPGASDFIDRNELFFSYYLEGLEKTWSDFTPKRVITYDYLHEGDYVLHVRSRNILGRIGQEISIPFKVLPPWYRTLWAYILYVLGFFGFVYLLIRLNSKRLIEANLRLEKTIAERTREINKQKLEIEHKNQEITDSINYAKGIQDSILPGIEEIKKSWDNLFVFFQPKDIVSGDFYWYKPVSDDEFLIACCDCTGHGVPGGFMSMICSGKLHDAAIESKEPDKILYLANNSIKESLRQQSGKSKDGMEICLLLVNIKTRKVKFSGANRPLWIYKKSSGGLEEVKPTKASIASSTDFNFTYDVTELSLDEGDVIYASSDGYADQFGGTGGKKYMSKNFKAYLKLVADKDMNEQLKMVRENINLWKGNYEQVDDLLVIGIRM